MEVPLLRDARSDLSAGMLSAVAARPEASRSSGTSIVAFSRASSAARRPRARRPADGAARGGHEERRVERVPVLLVLERVRVEVEREEVEVERCAETACSGAETSGAAFAGAVISSAAVL